MSRGQVSRREQALAWQDYQERTGRAGLVQCEGCPAEGDRYLVDPEQYGGPWCYWHADLPERSGDYALQNPTHIQDRGGL